MCVSLIFMLPSDTMHSLAFSVSMHPSGESYASTGNGGTVFICTACKLELDFTIRKPDCDTKRSITLGKSKLSLHRREPGLECALNM